MLEKVRALVTWAYLVVGVIAKPVYPTQQVRTRVDDIARQAWQMGSLSIMGASHMQPEDWSEGTL